jgi:hypothetical protein
MARGAEPACTGALGAPRGCYGRRAVEGTRALRWTAAPVATLAAVGLAGCGDDPRQSADETPGMYRLAIVRASFPARQRLAEPARLVIVVRNEGRATVPNLAVSVDSFGERSDRPDLSDAQRPVWIVDRPPRGSETAYASTWALGPLREGATRRLVWQLTPVRAGTHQVRFRLAAGLTGRAKALLAGDRSPERELTVRISARPSEARVDPETGAVVRGGG